MPEACLQRIFELFSRFYKKLKLRTYKNKQQHLVQYHELALTFAKYCSLVLTNNHFFKSPSQSRITKTLLHNIKNNIIVISV